MRAADGTCGDFGHGGSYGFGVALAAPLTWVLAYLLRPDRNQWDPHELHVLEPLRSGLAGVISLSDSPRCL